MCTIIDPPTSMVQYPTGRAQIDPGLAIVLLARVECVCEGLYIIIQVHHVTCMHTRTTAHVAPCVRTENGLK